MKIFSTNDAGTTRYPYRKTKNVDPSVISQTKLRMRGIKILMLLLQLKEILGNTGVSLSDLGIKIS